MKELTEKVLQFRNERNWSQFHNPKDLAISLSLEASELLENFQWKTSEEAIEERMIDIKDELADVIIYSILLANELGIDPKEAILQKIKKNELKYPVDKAFNSKKKYTEL
ncbi:nucleotide pyrophosphohydrolase [Peribacillus frigoritolerans]|uniref:nucleotide pyrophosphohydrolase n=1 Tax=Peribacillus frigoritolerans TaxID=450367 RepID=UPI003D004B94